MKRKQTDTLLSWEMKQKKGFEVNTRKRHFTSIQIHAARYMKKNNSKIVADVVPHRSI